MGSYFCGWYFRCQSETQTLAVIPSFHRTKAGRSCAIQLITDTQSFSVSFPASDFQKRGGEITIGENHFQKEGICLDIRQSHLSAAGCLNFGPFAPIRYDIMGPFRYVPFMQCRHSVYSMGHQVDGKLFINDTPYLFHHARGYIEGDRGYSFPRRYVWTQSFLPGGSLMLSVAEIPMGGFRFTGIIGIISYQGKEYRLATYLGARAVKIEADEIVVRQSRFTLVVRPKGPSGHPLSAPVNGAMARTIHEHPSCPVFYQVTENGVPLLEWDCPNAAFEYEY